MGGQTQHMEIFALWLCEVVHEFSEEGELLMGGGEDGVLAEVDFVLVELEALPCLEDMEGAALLLSLFLHSNLC